MDNLFEKTLKELQEERLDEVFDPTKFNPSQVIAYYNLYKTSAGPEFANSWLWVTVGSAIGSGLALALASGNLKGFLKDKWKSIKGYLTGRKLSQEDIDTIIKDGKELGNALGKFKKGLITRQINRMEGALKKGDKVELGRAYNALRDIFERETV